MTEDLLSVLARLECWSKSHFTNKKHDTLELAGEEKEHIQDALENLDIRDGWK